MQPELLAEGGEDASGGGGPASPGSPGASPGSPGSPPPSIARRLTRRLCGWVSWLGRGAAVSRRSGNAQAARIGFPLLHLLALVALALVTASYFGSVRPSSTVVGLICLLRAYELAFFYTTNPLFLMHRAAGVRAMRRQAAFMTTVQLHWVLRSADSLFALFFELEEIVRETRRLAPNLLRVRIYVTAATEQERETIQALSAGTALAGAFVFSRPDFCAVLAAAAQPLAAQSGALAATTSSKLLLDAVSGGSSGGGASAARGASSRHRHSLCPPKPLTHPARRRSTSLSAATPASPSRRATPSCACAASMPTGCSSPMAQRRCLAEVLRPISPTPPHPASRAASVPPPAAASPCAFAAARERTPPPPRTPDCFFPFETAPCPAAPAPALSNLRALAAAPPALARRALADRLTVPC